MLFSDASIQYAYRKQQDIYHIDVGVFTMIENHRIPISTLRVRFYSAISWRAR